MSEQGLSQESKGYYRGYAEAQDEMERLRSENAELRETLQLIRIKLGIRDDFIPLGMALELEPIIRKALATQKPASDEIGE